MEWLAFLVIAIATPSIQSAIQKMDLRWGGVIVAGTMFIPGLLFVWLFSDPQFLTRHSDPQVIRAYRAGNLTRGAAIFTFATISLIALFYLAVWRARRRPPPKSWRHSGELAHVPDVKRSFLVLLMVLLCAEIYLFQYQSLADAVETDNVSLARRRLSFNLAGLGPDNGIVIFDSQFRMLADPLLPVAVKRGNLEMVDLLLDHGAEINADRLKANRYSIQLNPLHYAVERNDRRMVLHLLERGAEPTGGVWAAAATNDVDSMQLLLASGADPCPGVAPATRNESIGVLDVLLRAGAEPSLGIPAALGHNNDFLMKYLYAMGADPTCALESAEHLGVKLLERVLADGADPVRARREVERRTQIGEELREKMLALIDAFENNGDVAWD